MGVGIIMAKTYYVSAKDGDDKNAGTEKKPFKRIQTGINKLTAGDTLLVRAGVYNEQLVINRSGDVRNPITIKGYPNERPLISGRNIKLRPYARLVSITRCRYVTFAGFDIQDSEARGLMVDAGSNITVDGCQVQGAQANGLCVIDCEETTIQNCVVRQCAQDYLSSGQSALTAAIFASRCDGLLIRGTRCLENPGEGIALSSVQHATLKGNTAYDNRASQISITSVRNTVVDSNFCYHTGRQQYLHLSGGRPPGIVKSDRRQYWTSGFWHTREVMIINNIVVGCSSGFECPQTGGSLTNVSVIHNSFVNSAEAAFRIESSQAHSGSLFENNLVANTTNGAMSRVARSGGLVWRHNFWSRNPEDTVYNPVNDVVDPNTGLRDINAPVEPGMVTTAPYELTAVSPAVNVGVRSQVAIDFYGRTRDGLPDIGAHEFDNSNPPGGGDEPVLPGPDERVSKGLLTLYDFSAGWGNTVTDVSGVGTPLNLTVQNTSAVQWTNQGLTIKTPTTISSSGPPAKILEACRASNEITIEAWVTPATKNQGGPSRIVSISRDPYNRNVTLSQGLKPGEPTSLYNVRLRTTNSDNNGIPSISSAVDSLQTELTHVVFTREKSGKAIIYINGQERAVDKLNGSFNNWDARFPFLLANERTGDRPWLGTYTLVAVFNRALLSMEVQHNYNVGLPKLDPLMADFRIRPGQEIGKAPHSVDFDSSDSYASSGIKSYAWTFGDNTTSTEPNPRHVYEKAGVYSVALTITDANGLTSTQTKTDFITVTDSVLPALPVDYARFIVANVVESRILALGIQYTDLRCVLAWNDDPYQIMIFQRLEDVVQRFVVSGVVEVVWVDHPDATGEEDEDN
jgi:PKD repeat protein/polygalacturonase